MSNLLFKLDEKEFDKYESLKQLVLKKYETPPKWCLENFTRARRNRDETFFQFASRLTSIWLCYCKLRKANDFESLNQLVVVEELLQTLHSEITTHIGMLQGEDWYTPKDLGKHCDIFFTSTYCGIPSIAIPDAYSPFQVHCVASDYGVK